MGLKAGNTCPGCNKSGMLVYTGRDKVTNSTRTYQRILKCNKCGTEYTEDIDRKLD